MSDIYVSGNAYQGTSQACVVDLTPPTFAGITGLLVGSRGQLRASWSAATDGTTPLRYEIYCQASTATGLFSAGNVVGITDALQFDFWTLRNGSFLQNGVTYYVGVRARDGVSNIDGNTSSLNVISTGILTSQDVYKVEGAFALGAGNQFQGTMWILKNSVLGLGATLGTASYQVYDKAGNAVPGMGQSGISADVNGQFKITPISSTLAQALEHYMVKVDITMDSAVRTGYVPLIEPIPEYNVEGVFGLSDSNQFVASFWATSNEQIIPSGSRLGTASYQVYDRLGNAVSGMTESGIAADSNGLFKITPVASTLTADLTFYSVKVSMTIDGIVRSDFLPIMGKVPAYECYAVVSVNALNQFQATLFIEADGKLKTGASLGTAAYQIYDAAGSPVSGMNQSGITADANGQFIITPVSSALLTDLTHFIMKVTITCDGLARTSMCGFSRLGT